MQKLLYGLLVLLLLMMLLLCLVSPWALIGVLIFAFGFYQLVQKNRGNVTFSQPGWFIIGGVLLVMILVGTADTSVEEPTETAKNTETAEKNEAVQTSQTVEEPKETKEQTEPDRITAKVLSVTDGDTLKADVDGKEETIRLVLVDTPETKHPQLGKQPLGEEAFAFTKEQLAGKKVEIELGIEERDRYGRLLAYVYVNGKMFNETLVEKGYARVAVYPPNTKYLEQLEKAQSTAEVNALGIWETENYVTEDGFDVAAYEPEPEPDPVAEEPATEPEPVVEEQEPSPEPVVEEPVTTTESFQNCTALRAVYPEGVPAGHPAYDSKHDRDGDNYACEN